MLGNEYVVFIIYSIRSLQSFWDVESATLGLQMHKKNPPRYQDIPFIFSLENQISNIDTMFRIMFYIG